ncbi:hypothetical protein BD779DRAFT_1470090 [Infundibulicybe gibba]|nr:hypothetical protein BD779DRAFT_1470090 [Infundibulicybe gibba]
MCVVSVSAWALYTRLIGCCVAISQRARDWFPRLGLIEFNRAQTYGSLRHNLRVINANDQPTDESCVTYVIFVRQHGTHPDTGFTPHQIKYLKSMVPHFATARREKDEEEFYTRLVAVWFEKWPAAGNEKATGRGNAPISRATILRQMRRIFGRARQTCAAEDIFSGRALGKIG